MGKHKKKPNRGTTQKDSHRLPGNGQLKRQGTLRAFINRAREVVGLKKSEIKMDDTQSTNSVYDTATARTFMEESSSDTMTPGGGLTKSAKKRQKLMERLAARCVPFVFKVARPDDLYSWSQAITDTNLSEEERAEPLHKMNEVFGQTDDWLERLLMRKLVANWGVPIGIGETRPGGNLNREVSKFWQLEKKDTVCDENGNSTVTLVLDLLKKTTNSGTMGTVLKHLTTASEEKLTVVLRVLQGCPMASPTPADPEPPPPLLVSATPTKSETFSVTIRTTPSHPSSPTSSTPAIVTGGPPAPPPPPAIVTGGPPAPPPPTPSSSRSIPPTVPPPPPPDLFSNASPFSSLRQDLYDKSSRTMSIRMSRHKYARRPTYLGEVRMETNELPDDEREMLEEYFPEVKKEKNEETKKKGSRLSVDDNKVDRQRAMNMEMAINKIAKDLKGWKEFLEKLTTNDGKVPEVAAGLLSCWPTEEEQKKFGQMDGENLGKNEYFCWKVANCPELKMVKTKLEFLRAHQNADEDINTLKAEMKKWHQTMTKMKSEVFSKIVTKLLVWINFLNQGSLDPVAEMTMQDVKDSLRKMSTIAGTDVTIGRLLVKKLELDKEYLQELRCSLDQEKVRLRTMVEIDAEITAKMKEAEKQEKRLFEQKALKKELGGSVEQMKSKAKELQETWMKIKEEGENIKEKLNEDPKTLMEDLLANQKAVLDACLEAIIKNEQDKQSVRQMRSISMVDIAQPEESRPGSLMRNSPFRASLHVPMGLEKQSPDMADGLKRFFLK